LNNQLFRCHYIFPLNVFLFRLKKQRTLPTIGLIIISITSSELVQLKLNISTSVGESTPTEVEIGTPTYRSGCLGIGNSFFINREEAILYALMNLDISVFRCALNSTWI
jgi:hypothetical protein